MSSTALKLIALAAMFIDHVGAFIPGMPHMFRIIGRISAPVFLYCCIWGFHYTKNKSLYLLRLDVFSVLMGVICFVLNSCFPGGYHEPSNNIFATLLLICLFIEIYEKGANKNIKSAAAAFTLLNAAAFAAYTLLSKGRPAAEAIFSALFPSVITCEGGILTFIMGLIFYFNKDSKSATAKGYTLFCLVYLGMVLILNTPLFRLYTLDWFTWLFVRNYQWLQIAALPLILCYNGQKGKGLKYLFYIFYLVHITVLYLAGYYMCR